MKTVYLSQLDVDSYDIFEQTVLNENPTEIVFLCETEWYSHLLDEKLATLLNNHNVKLTVVFGSYDCELYHTTWSYFNNLQIISWNTYWLNWSMMCSSILDFNRTYDTFKYPFICLNNKNHIHRSAIVDELTGQGLLDRGIITWHRFPNRHLKTHGYQFKYYDDNIRLIGDDFATKLDSFLIPEEYHQSFLHVVGEATISVPFITEKTCLPILFKKPFVIMADPGFHKKLIDLGFEMYDEIIDYSFDDEVDLTKRAEAIAIQVKRVSEQNVDELYKLVKDKTERNYQNYIRIINDINYIPDVIRRRVNILRNDFTVELNSTDMRYINMHKYMGM